MKKVLILILSFIFIFALFVPNLVYGAGPDVVANLLGANYLPTGSFTDTTNVTTGSRVQIYLEISDRTAGVNANNLHVKVNLPTTVSNTQVVQADISGSNFSPNPTDTTTINITNSAGKLVYVPGSTTLTWDSGSGPTYTNNVMPDDLTTAGFDFAPSLQPGTPYSIQLAFLVDAVQSSGGGSSQPAPQGNPGGGGPAQAPVCGDTKPGKVTLKSVDQQSSSSVKLTWDKATNADDYAINFGIKTKSYQYGVTKTGNINQFTIGSLNPNTKYFFVILPTHGCMPGDWSNEISNTPIFETKLTKSSDLNTLDLSNQIASKSSSSSLESSPATSPSYNSPTSNSSNKKGGVNWTALLIAAGIVLLTASGITYYRSPKRKTI